MENKIRADSIVRDTSQMIGFANEIAFTLSVNMQIGAFHTI